MDGTKLVLEGTFDAFSVDEVLEVVSMSRQRMEVRFRESLQDETGRIVVKAGRVLSASLPSGMQGRQAFAQLYQAPGHAFAVLRQPDAVLRGPSLGTLASLVEQARSPAPAPSQVVLRSTFAGFTFRELLDVVSWSRQTMVVTLGYRDGREGRLVCRSGMLLEAVAPDGRISREGFAALVADPGQSFEVRSQSRSVIGRRPIGSLAEVLAQAATVGTSEPDQPVLEGALADFSLLDVLDVLSISRQRLELILRDGAGVRGSLVTQAGQLLEAQSLRSESSGIDGFRELFHDPGSSFSVVRRAGTSERSLGGLAELTALVTAQGPVQPPAVPRRVLLLEGTLADFTLDEVLDVVSLTRQPVELTLFRGPTLLGSLMAKAGQLLGARLEAGEREGVQALAGLLASDAERFAVHRIPRPEHFAVPLGPLAEVLSQVASQAAERRIVLEGVFGEFTFAELLSVAALSRQYLEVVLRSPSGERGRLLVKSGVLLRAHARQGPADPVEAFLALARDPGEGFALVHVEEAPTVSGALASVSSLLERAHEEAFEDEPEPTLVVEVPVDRPRVAEEPAPLQAALQALAHRAEQDALERAAVMAALERLEAEMVQRSGSPTASRGWLAVLVVSQGLTLVLLVLALAALLA